MLSHFAGDQDWPALLPVVAAAYNTSTHATTGFTPFELVHGSSARTLLKAEFEAPAAMQQKTYREYLQQLEKKLTLMRKAAKDRISKEQASRTDPFEPVYKTGELVWCRNFTARKGVKGKFDAKFEGPYVVMESRPPDYVIKKGKKKRLIHGAHLKRGDTWQTREAEVREDRGEVLLKTTESTSGSVPLARGRASASAAESEREQEDGQLFSCQTPQWLTSDDFDHDRPGPATASARTSGGRPGVREATAAADEGLPQEEVRATADEEPPQEEVRAAAHGGLSQEEARAAADEGPPQEEVITTGVGDGVREEAVGGWPQTDAADGRAEAEAAAGGRLQTGTAAGERSQTETVGGRLQTEEAADRPPLAGEQLQPGTVVGEQRRRANARRGRRRGTVAPSARSETAESEASESVTTRAGRKVVLPLRYRE